jgi:hypothetical protein
MPDEEKETEEKEISPDVPSDNLKNVSEGKDESEEETSELEEKIEHEENILSDNQFQDTLELRNFSPSLKKRNASQNESFVRLEQTLEDAPVSNIQDEEDDPFKYSATKKSTDSPKYISYDSDSSAGISRLSDIEKDARKSPLERMPSVGFISSESSSLSPEKKYEVYNPVQQTDMTKLGKETELEKLERKEIKYKPSR